MATRQKSMVNLSKGPAALKPNFEQLVRPEFLTGRAEVSFDGVERILNHDASFECEPELFQDGKSCASSVE